MLVAKEPVGKFADRNTELTCYPV